MTPLSERVLRACGLMLAAGLAGCATLTPTPIPAIEALTLDADGVRLRAAPPGARGGWQLLVRFEIVSAADVRRGEAFAVWDGRSISDWYELLWFDEHVATFKRTRVVDERAADGSYSATSEVVRLAPYDLRERTDAAGAAGDGAASRPASPMGL